MSLYLLLSVYDERELSVWYTWVELTAHECSALVVLDVTSVTGLGHLDVF